LSSRATPRWRRLFGLSLLTPLLAASCYHAEIDLKPLLDSDSSGTSGSGGQTAVGQGGLPELVAGGAPEETAGAAGVGGDVGIECDDAPLDDEQNACLLLPPTMAECDAQRRGDWKACYAGGCMVCTPNEEGVVPGYPYYFKWHPCCRPNSTCSVHPPEICDARCPAPTEHDAVPPCSALPSMQH
jgi:hypothetical protein